MPVILIQCQSKLASGTPIGRTATKIRATDARRRLRELSERLTAA